MKIYDISQEVFECCTFASDPKPNREVIYSMNDGSLYNLTAFSMCVHNGTHIDAPAHFIKKGATIDKLSLDKMVGTAYVCYHNGLVRGEHAEKFLREAREACGDDIKIILIRGRAALSFEAAQEFAYAGLTLVGCEFQSIAAGDMVIPVHRLLLDKGVLILEGLRMDFVNPGKYFLCAAPLNLGDCEGSPCRAILIDFEDNKRR